MNAAKVSPNTWIVRAGSLHHHYVMRKVAGVFEVHRRGASKITRIGTAHTMADAKQLIADTESTWV
jgi:NADH:ubiquinone oxidoreductase subunit H